jgi:hypothetical protein
VKKWLEDPFFGNEVKVLNWFSMGECSSIDIPKVMLLTDSGCTVRAIHDNANKICRSIQLTLSLSNTGITISGLGILKIMDTSIQYQNQQNMLLSFKRRQVVSMKI